MNRHNTVTRKNVRSGQIVKLSRRYECSCRFLHLISQPDSSPVYHNREMDDNIPAAISILKQNNNHCFHPHPGYSLVTMPENGKRLTREWQPLRAPLTGMASDARRYEDLFRRFAPPSPEGKAFGRATQRRPYGMASDARRYGLAGKLTVPCFCFLFPVVAGDREIAPTGFSGILTVSCSCLLFPQASSSCAMRCATASAARPVSWAPRKSSTARQLAGPSMGLDRMSRSSLSVCAAISGDRSGSK